MKTSLRQLFSGAAMAFCVTFAAFAQDTPPTPPAPATPADPQVAPPPPESSQAPAAVAVPAEPAVIAPAAAPAAELRRLDQPTKAGAKSAPKAGKDDRVRTRITTTVQSGNERIAVGHDVHLAKGEAADAVVAVFGSATSDGEVGDAIVSILGDTRATGPVGDAAVAVFGSTYVNNKVGDAVVAVLGNVELGPEADVGGDVVAVGGKVIRDPKAVLHGTISNVSLPGYLADVSWLRSWFYECLFYGRLLAFKTDLGWAWSIAIAALACYVFIALLFRGGVEKCLNTLESRPGYSVLTALFTVLLSPVVIILLIVTGIGIFLVPFVGAGLFFAALFGKVVMLGWLGRKFTRFLGDGPLGHVAFAVLVGGLIVMLLYTVPVLGILLYKLIGWLGLGVVIYTLILGMKRDKPAAPPAGLVVPVAGIVAGDPAVTAVVAAPPVVTGSTLPRAGFWIRTAALLLDVILIGIICGLLSDMFPRGSHLQIKAGLLPTLALYGALMWKFRGSTIGGIICGLKVVRLDDRPIDWGTAIARALGCFLSLVVVGLGFIWVAFDAQRQSWHDKIAGTTVVRAPRGVSLL